MSCVTPVRVSHVSPNGVRNSLSFSWVCLPGRNSSMDRHREVGGRMDAQELGKKCSLFHTDIKSSGGPPRVACAGLWQQEPLRRSLGHRQSGETCTPHARKHMIPSVGLGLRRLQDPPHSGAAEAAKAQDSGGAWHCWIPPVTLSLHKMHIHSTGGKNRQVSCIHPALPTRSTAKEEHSSRPRRPSLLLSQQEGE